MYATKNGYFEIVKMLLAKKEIDFNARNIY